MYENSGRLFKNDKKQPGDKRPDYTGDFTDQTGKKMRCAAWIKDGKQGGKWLSFKVSEIQEQTSDQAFGTGQSLPVGGGDLDDEIPF